jgi:hypothetical protein
MNWYLDLDGDHVYDANVDGFYNNFAAAGDIPAVGNWNGPGFGMSCFMPTSGGSFSMASASSAPSTSNMVQLRTIAITAFDERNTMGLNPTDISQMDLSLDDHAKDILGVQSEQGATLVRRVEHEPNRTQWRLSELPVWRRRLLETQAVDSPLSHAKLTPPAQRNAGDVDDNAESGLRPIL